MLTWILLLAGFALLIVGAESLVRGAVALARRLGISPLMIGLTVVAWGTSAPELVVTVQATLEGTTDVAVANVVGSNIFNVLITVGIVAVVQPIHASRRAVLRDGTAAFLAAAAFVLVASTLGVVTAWVAGGFLCALLVLSFVVFRQERANAARAREVAAELDAMAGDGVIKSSVFVVVGLGMLAVGGDLLVNSAVTLARAWGVSEAMIGATIVAAGTSLPETTTCLIAALRRHGDVAFGNVVGSNLYNLLAILGVAGLIAPLPVPEPVRTFDMWWMLAASAALLLPLATGFRIGRWIGAGLLGAYVLWLAMTLARI